MQRARDFGFQRDSEKRKKQIGDKTLELRARHVWGGLSGFSVLSILPIFLPRVKTSPANNPECCFACLRSYF